MESSRKEIRTASPAAQVERAVLGICLLENEAERELIVSILAAHHFDLDSHRRIFAHICRLHSGDQPVNMLTLSESLRHSGETDAIGGLAYAYSLTEGLPRSFPEDSIRNYCERVKEYWRLRELERIGVLMQAEAEDSGSTAASILQSASERMEAIVDDSSSDEPSVSHHIAGFLERMWEQRKLVSSPGMSYGLADLDENTGGMMPGEQTAVGAVSGIGKTAFMCQCIFGALAAGHPVDAFLIEPTRDQVIARIISLLTGVRYEALMKPWKMRRDEQEPARLGALRLGEMPLRTFARSTMTLDEVLGHARLGMRKYGTRLVCLDYVQRLKIRQAERDEPVRLRVGRASTALADLVKNTQTHALVLSQITTGRKSGPNSLPTMFDFRESSQIENDAHTIVLLHREFDETRNHYTNSGNIFVPKQRNGVPSSLEVSFDPLTAAWAEPKRFVPGEFQDRRNYV